MSDLNMNYFFNKTYYDFLKNIESKYIGEEIDDEIKVNGKFIKDIIKENNIVI